MLSGLAGLGTVDYRILFLIWIWNSIYIIKEWERGVVLRLGRFCQTPRARV